MPRITLARAVVGERVRLALVAARPEGLSTRQLIDVTELTLYQVRNGLRWIRETAAAEHLTPLTWTLRGGYAFSDDPSDWIIFEKRQLDAVLNKLRLTLTGVFAPHLQRIPSDPYVTMALQQINGVIAALEFVKDNARRNDADPAVVS
ncbi:hypothetical protein [Amycolatopsis sp. H20-H5]|uniref:hypothetical protein n=1 Tax=Amycolatopsis sp. H20-H5 TaxID=3046309 RepID=UPI002DBD014A|nr:hypothetical protein [Amycolatopsis sp. H20-H5]MEC3982552.1 hypothetical protein [Amycolatopsis sp. H20-H5]